MTDMNKNLDEQFADIFANIFPSYSQMGGLKYDDGTLVEWDIGADKNLYRYYAHPTTDKRYCWTPWKDTKGWYWAFNYVDSDDGSRLLVKDAVKFRKRKMAKQRATNRFDKDNS